MFSDRETIGIVFLGENYLFRVFCGSGGGLTRKGLCAVSQCCKITKMECCFSADSKG